MNLGKSRGRSRRLRLVLGEEGDVRAWLRYPALALFCAAGAFALWVPAREAWDTLESFSGFRAYGDAALAGPAAPALSVSEGGTDGARAVAFRLLAPAAQKVFVMGSFTEYRSLAMKRRPDGLWETRFDLPPGRHLYKFKVDGRWQLDPTNAERTTGPRPESVLEIH